MSRMCLSGRLPLAALALGALVGAVVWGWAMFPSETTAEDDGPQVIATVSLGSRDEVSLSDDVAVDPERNRIYVVSNEYDAEKVFIVDGSTNTVTDTIVVGEHIYGVGVNPTTDRIYLSISSTPEGPLAGVQVIDGQTKTVLEHIEGIWGHVAVDPVANRIFTHDTSGYNDLLAIIDGASHEVSTVNVGSSSYIEKFIPEVNPQTGLVYVTYGGDDKVTVVDPGAKTVVTKIDIGAWPGRPVVNPETNRIYLQNLVANEIVVVEGSSHSVVARIPGTGEHLAVNPVTNRLYRSKQGDIDVIDGTTNSVVSTFTWSEEEWGNYVRVMAVNPQANRLYIGGSVQSNEVVVVVQDGGAAPPSGPTASPTPVPPVQGTMHDCPQAGKWAISVWDGGDGADVAQALGNCGEGAVAAAYRIDPGTQAWSRWFSGRAEISNLSTLDRGQGVLALGGGVSASWAEAETPLRAAANGMLGCPQPGKWAISVWDGADGTSTEQAVATCGEGSVNMLYWLDPDSQGWKRYVSGRPEVSNLNSLNRHQGALALGSVTGPTPTLTPTATSTPTPTATAPAYGELPPPQKTGSVAAGGKAQVTISNNAPHTLTIDVEGPVSQSFTIPKCEECTTYMISPIFCPEKGPEETFTLPPGEYTVTVRADDPSVTPLQGQWDLEGNQGHFFCYVVIERITFG
jgi:DNA-binding beta-propeller fold protein YncE